MSVSVTYNGTLSTAETPVIDAGHMAAGQKITSTLGQALGGLGAASTPPCSSRAGADLLVSAAHLDLTTAVGLNGVAVSGAGLRVQFAKFACPIGNAAPVTIAVGASNGCNNFGATFFIALAPGAEVLFMLNSGGSVIGGANKVLDIGGTGTDTLSYEIIFG
jgi:hypothetical protein